MFEKKDPFPWKIPILILTGIIVLSSGIYIGVKTIDKNPVKTNVKVEQPNEKAKEAFALNKDCEIWLQKNYDDGSNSNKSPIMIGTIPKELLNKTEVEIVSYFKNKYPDRKIESMSKYEIVLSENTSVNDSSKANKYSIEDNGGFIGLYKYNDEGKKELIEKTHVKIESLPKSVQDEIEKGVLLDTEEQAYSRLENFCS